MKWLRVAPCDELARRRPSLAEATNPLSSRRSVAPPHPVVPRMLHRACRTLPCAFLPRNDGRATRSARTRRASVSRIAITRRSPGAGVSSVLLVTAVLSSSAANSREVCRRRQTARSRSFDRPVSAKEREGRR